MGVMIFIFVAEGVTGLAETGVRLLSVLHALCCAALCVACGWVICDLRSAICGDGLTG